MLAQIVSMIFQGFQPLIQAQNSSLRTFSYRILKNRIATAAGETLEAFIALHLLSSRLVEDVLN